MCQNVSLPGHEQKKQDRTHVSGDCGNQLSQAHFSVEQQHEDNVKFRIYYVRTTHKAASEVVPCSTDDQNNVGLFKSDTLRRDS